MASILKLVPLSEKQVIEVNQALKDLIQLAQHGSIDGLIFQFHTRDGEHLHGLAGHYRLNLTEAVGVLACLNTRLCTAIED